MQFETETDLGVLDFVHARQPNSNKIVTWEIAGTSHADQSTLDYGVASAARWTTGKTDFTQLCGTINDGPQAEVLRAAYAAMTRWVVDGARPPTPPRLTTDGTGAIVRDELGIAKGGIRTAAVDAPLTILTGKSQASSIFCSLFGSRTPLTPEQIRERYPTSSAYVDAVTRSTKAAQQTGYLLPADADAIIAAAKKTPFPA
ncbi:hypothetical protein I6A60_39350 [Frankia sp. AgB1.9]|uniref:alpha/beta hydrolase domain-containing protein n=1 Tax=unclassified Frankia TaxID=2632575 RepID=UPI00193379E5|nr:MULTISPECIES: alpha/beta hydrolase domain-containing protein [unclassified Frankia]MBL7491614.1 hypothetical protein [Frankia sp. AgW1.1]MBL7553841.1 hypothetical protein [Frankia sp. AgB1.9]MBL7618086.1 hypothetical protein [Frankia sp. AgB1.8]